jgi:hypothetical protein
MVGIYRMVVLLVWFYLLFADLWHFFCEDLLGFYKFLLQVNHELSIGTLHFVGLYFIYGVDVEAVESADREVFEKGGG